MNQKRTLLTILFTLLALVVLGCSNGDAGGDAGGDAQSSTAAGADATLPPIIQTNQIVSAEAIVVPVRNVDLAFEAGGRVTEILVSEGDVVEKDQPLAHLDNADAIAAVAIAQANLVQAQANLDQVKAGPTEEQIAVAQAVVDRAQANLEQVQAGPTEEQTAIAAAAIARAETTLAQVISGATAEERAIAQARVNILQAQLVQATSSAREEILAVSMASVRQAEADLALAQSEYDKIAYAADSDIGQPIALNLQKATLAYEAAQANFQALLNGASPQEIAVLRAQLAEGQAALNQVEAGATPEQIALAQIGVMEAEANLAQVMNGATPEQVAVAAVGVKEAEANLAQVLAGSTSEQIAAAEATVKQAEASLAQAELALSRTELKAPFSGVVTSLDLEVGQLVAGGSPVLNVADLSIWQIETDDLTEIDVVRVVEGQPVDVRFDALSDETFVGQVTRIKPRSETKAGDVTYTVLIDLENNTDPRLRWGMTTFVEINAE